MNATRKSQLVDGPVRRIGVQRRSITGTLPDGSRYESSLERDFLLLMHFDPLVDVCTPQPVTIPYRDRAGAWHRYTPDVLVEYLRSPAVRDPRPWLVEIKHRADLEGQAWSALPRFRAARDHARAWGWRFSICTEENIRTPLLDNARFLMGYLKRQMSIEQALAIDDTLRAMGQATPATLLQAIDRDPWKRAAMVPALWRLIARREIGCDLVSPLTMDSRIWTLRNTDR